MRDGHGVIAAARRTERLASLGEELGAGMLALTLDVTDAPAVAALPASLPEGWREVDVVNNAGLALGMEPASAGLAGGLGNHGRPHVLGVIRMSRPCARHGRRDRGHVVNIASTAAA